MQIKSKPVDKRFNLQKDPEKAAYIIVRQATFREEKLRADAFSTRRTLQPRNRNEHAVTEENFNTLRVWQKEIFVSLVEAGGFFVGNDELFRFKSGKLDMTEDEFSEAFDKLPIELITEMHDCVLELNPTWGTPSTASEEQKAGQEAEGATDDGKAPLEA